MLLQAAATAAPAPALSWGLPGVSFTQYRADAFDCSYTALTVSIPADTSRFEAPGADDSLDDYMLRARRYDLQRRHAEMQIRQAAIDRCLVARGYQRFRLTAEQQAHLNALPRGTQQRHQYLYSLATDRAVVRTQQL